MNASDGTSEGATAPEAKRPNRLSAGLIVLFIVLLGALIGGLSYVVMISTYHFYPFVFRGPPGSPGQGFDVFASYLAFHVILSTVSIGLLFALIGVYARTYFRTRANFIFGLLIVLFALLIQNLVNYPLLNPFINVQPLEFSSFGFSSPFADVFTIIAYAVFLYLSLE